MTAYEKYLGRPETKEDAIHAREWYVAKLYTKKEMLTRWRKINYQLPKFKQLTIWDY